MQAKSALHRNLKRMLAIYAPAINIIYLMMLMYSMDIHADFTHQAYALYACGVPIIFTLSKVLGMCRLHRFSLLNPLIAPVIMWLTPVSYDPAIRIAGCALTIGIIIWLLVRFGKKSHCCSVRWL